MLAEGIVRPGGLICFGGGRKKVKPQSVGESDRLNTKNCTVDLKEIKAIIDLMKKNAVSEFELEKQDFKIRLKRGMNSGGVGISPSEDSQPMVAYAQVSTVLPSGSAPAVALPPAS